ncbi:nucleobase:cation symporter-2 family protein [Marinicrinis lubricantis]|uniref:Nucleobase:cation symporter-2 family protein n=1 Tax=Marinicrinis lubricantis TaxID=2086470 RepID=A0ABW1IKE4_9BACL
MLKQGKVVSLGIQHVLAMYAGAVIVPILVAVSLGMDQKQLTYLISIDLLTSGLATLLQVWTNRFFGIGLPVVLGCTFTAVAPMISIGQHQGITAIYGAIIASALFVILISGVFSKLVRFFPPVVTGSVVMIIGLSLIPVAMNNIAGGDDTLPDYGSGKHVALAFGVLILIILLNRFTKGFLRAVSILIGLIAGTIAAALMGQIDFGEVSQASWVSANIHPFYFGAPTFNLSAILTMILVSIVSLVESTGVFMALGKITDRKLESKDLAKGYRAEGLAMLLGGTLNALPYTTFSQNVGLVQMSKIKTKNVIIVAGILLVLLGLSPKVAALTSLIPSPVLGGAMIAMFGMVISSGIQILGGVDLNDNENLFIIACSVGIGLGVTIMPGIFASLPEQLEILASNGIVMGGLAAILLNLMFHAGKSKLASTSKDASAEGSAPTASSEVHA